MTAPTPLEPAIAREVLVVYQCPVCRKVIENSFLYASMGAWCDRDDARMVRLELVPIDGLLVRGLRARLAILARALRWYGNTRNWKPDDWNVQSVVAHPDYGRPGLKARRALARVGL